MANKIILASDYRGVELREWLVQQTHRIGIEVKDLGIQRGSPIDYIDISRLLAEEMHLQPETMGMIACGSGQGVAIVLNRFNHLRACVCRTLDDARQMREKLNANILCLGSRHTSNEDALRILNAFISTPFTGGKHLDCVNKLAFNVTNHATNGVNLIVRAIIVHEKHILMTTVTDKHPHFDPNLYFLPGGHVDYNESTFDALKREIFEEMELEVVNANFSGVLECSWHRHGMPYHEINIVYSTSINGLNIQKPPRSSDNYQQFVWVPLSKIQEIDLLPVKLKELITYALNGKEKLHFFSEMKA